MKWLVFADLHFVDYAVWRKFLSIDHSQFDALVLLGDIDIMYLKSIRENFTDKPIFGVLGNHDYLGDLEYYEIPNLHGRTETIGDLEVIGIEGCLCYKPTDKETPIHYDGEISVLLRELPSADVVISHNSPRGIHDRDDVAHLGYAGLVEFIETKKPRFLLHGHQHRNVSTVSQDTKVIGIYGVGLFDTVTGELHQILDLDSIEV